MEKLYDIIRNNRMSTRPEYYSGRGATLSDLNGQILEGIYKGIEKEFGRTAANNYVKMVADIKVLSATTFLEELYSLYRSDWKYRKKKQHAPGVSVPKNKDGEYDDNSVLVGAFGMVSALFSDGRDDTDSIRSNFLSWHGHKTKKVVDSSGYCHYYFD